MLTSSHISNLLTSFSYPSPLNTSSSSSSSPSLSSDPHWLFWLRLFSLLVLLQRNPMSLGPHQNEYPKTPFSHFLKYGENKESYAFTIDNANVIKKNVHNLKFRTDSKKYSKKCQGVSEYYTNKNKLKGSRQSVVKILHNLRWISK